MPETNLALLKLQLLFHGIRAGQNLPSPLTNPFGLIHLALPEKVFVSVHLDTNGSESPFTLREGKAASSISISQARTRCRWAGRRRLRAIRSETSSGVLVVGHGHGARRLHRGASVTSLPLWSERPVVPLLRIIQGDCRTIRLSRRAISWRHSDSSWRKSAATL